MLLFNQEIVGVWVSEMGTLLREVTLVRWEPDVRLPGKLICLKNNFGS